MARTQYRVRFEYDDETQFEECNGENRPLTEEEYAENEYMGCPVHPRAKTRPKSKTSQGIGVCTICGRESQPIPYSEYLDYYGNPDRHDYIGCIVDKQCHCCGEWTVAASVWGIDLMTDSEEMRALDTSRPLTPTEALALPGYLAEVAREELLAAGARMPKRRTRS